jgi:hypothetical protein
MRKGNPKKKTSFEINFSPSLSQKGGRKVLLKNIITPGGVDYNYKMVT